MKKLRPFHDSIKDFLLGLQDELQDNEGNQPSQARQSAKPIIF
jgi:hypothetical protein